MILAITHTPEARTQMKRDGRRTCSLTIQTSGWVTRLSVPGTLDSFRVKSTTECSSAAVTHTMSVPPLGLSILLPTVGYSLGLGADAVQSHLNDGNHPGAAAPHRESQIAVPSDFFAFMDSLGEWTHLNDPVDGSTSGWVGEDETMAPIDTLNFVPAAKPAWPSFQNPPQHDKFFNIAYPDGHVGQTPRVNLFYSELVGPSRPFSTAAEWNIDHQAHYEDCSTGSP